MKHFVNLFLCLIGLLMVQPSSAQVNNAPAKHPRVLEVEKMLNKEGLDFLRARFPGRPFIVTVSIDPLHRPKKDDAKENLPYYDMLDEERFDEWDDPSIPAIALLGRVQKINLVLTVPADLSEDELTEIKSSLISSLGMIEARDNIEIRKRTWLAAPSGESSRLTIYNILVVGMFLAILLAGLFGTVFSASSRLAKALKESSGNKAAGDQGGSGGNITITASDLNGSGVSMSGGGGGGGFGGTSDVKMLDSLRFREHVATGIKLLSAHTDFPRMEDMLIFEAFAQRNPGEFGAFIAEMPHDLRMKLFSLSRSAPWLEAMTEPTDVGNLTLENMQKCLRIQRNEKESAWENLLVLVWRLDTLADKFFSGSPQAEAMTIMAHLPKGDGVRWARTMYPGNWGQILDPAFQPKPLNETQIQKYAQKAISILPLRKVDVLQNYQAEKAVLQYVRIAPIQVEKEVYLAAGPKSTLREVRPPFYLFYDLTKEQCVEILPRFRVEEWAIALFNTPKPDRALFESTLNPKQKVRMYEVFRKLETKNPTPTAVAEVREKIAVQIGKLVVEVTPVEEPIELAKAA